MSAEQQSPLFSLSSSYNHEETPSKVELQKLADESRQFNLFSSFYGIRDLVRRHGKEKGVLYATLSAMLNILSLRQEMLGNMDTNDLIHVVVPDTKGAIHFFNDHFGQVSDIRTLLYQFLSTIEEKNPVAYPRYKREDDQAIKVLERLTEQVIPLFEKQTNEEYRKTLQSLGFHKEIITLSPSFIVSTPSFRSHIQNADDLQRVLEHPPKKEVWVGPHQAITISPPHWLHRGGETGFVWAGECLVFEETREVIIRQNGKFGASQLNPLLQYLSYQQIEERQFQTEEEIMMFVNLLSTTAYRQPKVLLDYLVRELGGIQSVGKIDKGIRRQFLRRLFHRGTMNISPYFKAVQSIFSVEVDMLSVSEEAVRERLEELSDKMKHQIARDNPRALKKLADEYCSQIQENPSMETTAFAQRLTDVAIKIDPGFKIPINFSLLDCVAGTPLSFVGQASGISSLASGEFGSILQGKHGEHIALSTHQSELLRRYPRGKDKHRIQSLQERDEFCHAFHLDQNQFSQKARCPLCDKETFVWPMSEGGCGVCAVCQIWDDLSSYTEASPSVNSIPERTPTSEEHTVNEHQVFPPRTTINDTIAGIFSRCVFSPPQEFTA